MSRTSSAACGKVEKWMIYGTWDHVMLPYRTVRDPNSAHDKSELKNYNLQQWYRTELKTLSTHTLYIYPKTKAQKSRSIQPFQYNTYLHDAIGFTQLSCDDVLKFDRNCQISGSRSISLNSQKLPAWFFVWPRTSLFCHLKAFMLWFQCCASTCFVWLKWFWQVVSLSVYCDSVVSEVFPVAILSGLRIPQCSAVYYGVQCCLLWSALQSFRSSPFRQGLFLYGLSEVFPSRSLHTRVISAFV